MAWLSAGGSCYLRQGVVVCGEETLTVLRSGSLRWKW